MFFYSRDVIFQENIFPFKHSSVTSEHPTNPQDSLILFPDVDPSLLHDNSIPYSVSFPCHNTTFNSHTPTLPVVSPTASCTTSSDPKVFETYSLDPT